MPVYSSKLSRSRGVIGVAQHHLSWRGFEIKFDLCSHSHECTGELVIYQSGPVRRAMRAAFMGWCIPSTTLLDSGWYAVVWLISYPRDLESSAQSEDVNCGPRSEVIKAGTPNLEIQL